MSKTTSSFPPAAIATLKNGLHQLQLPTALATPLLNYLALLQRWNHSYNLTAIREPQQMVIRHVLDSLTLVPHLQGKTLADLGSGAGLPGIPLALACPQLQVTLIESSRKKARFLREVVRHLQLNNVAVINTRIETVAHPAYYDLLCARALASLADLIKTGGRLLHPEGKFLAMKGVYPAEELAALPKDWQARCVYILKVPFLDHEQRHLVVLEKENNDAIN